MTIYIWLFSYIYEYSEQRSSWRYTSLICHYMYDSYKKSCDIVMKSQVLIAQLLSFRNLLIAHCLYIFMSVFIHIHVYVCELTFKVAFKKMHVF